MFYVFYVGFAIVVFFSVALRVESTEFKIKTTHILQIQSEESGLNELYIRFLTIVKKTTKIPVVL
ncbi:hypothetical protein LFREDSHE_24960 [Shewanella baltica]